MNFNRKNKFYTVSAFFDMSTYSEVVTRSFIERVNANQFAKVQQEVFLKQIPENGALNEDESEEDHSDGLFYFYGISKEYNNFITIKVTEEVFYDSSNSLIMFA